MIERRTFLGVLTGGLLAVPLAAEAQLASRVARVGLLSVGAALSDEEFARFPFLTALKDLGWKAGQNIVFEARYAAGQPDRLPTLAAGR